jgi:hypothetical protein
MIVWECSGGAVCAGKCVQNGRREIDDSLTPKSAALVYAETIRLGGSICVHVEQKIRRGPRKGTRLHTFRVERVISYRVSEVR